MQRTWVTRTGRGATYAALFGLICLVIPTQNGWAMGGEPSTVVSCPTEAPQADALCSALTQALREHLSGARFRESLSDAPLATDTRGVRLVLSSISADRLSGYLEWQSRSSGLQKGPELSLDVMDVTLTSARYPRFIQALLKASPGLSNTLTGRL